MRAASKPGWIEREGRPLLALSLVLVVLLAALPIVRLVLAALGGDPPGQGFARLIGVALAARTLAALGETLLIAALSGAAAILLGGALALTLALTDVAHKRLLAFLIVMSLMVAPQVAALAFKALAGPGSPLLNALGLAPPLGTPNPMLSRGGIVLVMALHHAPLAAIAIAAGLASVPRAVIEAATSDGARPLALTRHIVLPMIRPHIAGACVLVAIAGFGNFGIPALLGLPVNIVTLPTLVYQSLASFGPTIIPDAARLAVVMALVAGLGVAASSLLARHSPEPLEPGEAMLPVCRLGVWRWPLTGLVWIAVVVMLLLPSAALLASALVPAYGMTLTLETATLSRFVEVLLRQSVTSRALVNSLLLAGTAALLLAALTPLVAYALTRAGRRWITPALAIAELTYALPGIVIAIAAILLFLKPLPLIGISLYATPAIILAAYLMRFFALALKPALAAMSLVDRAQEEAAAIAGAGLCSRLAYIVLPTLAPAAAAGGMMVFLLAFNELTVSALLYSAGTETLGVALLSLDDAGLGAEAAAVGVVATLIVAAIMIVLDRLAPWLPPGVLPWVVLAGAAPTSARR